jgi:hypothetical protein
MLSRLCALWLVTLIVLPFTAPFSACGDAPSSRSHSPARSLADSATSHALPVARAVVRAKHAVSATDARLELQLPQAAERIHHVVFSRQFVAAPLEPPLRI